MSDPITDSESMSEDPQSFDEPLKWDMYNEPCPYCGATEFLDTSQQDYIVECDDDGVPEEFVPQEQIDTLEVHCRGCERQLY